MEQRQEAQETGRNNENGDGESRAGKNQTRSPHSPRCTCRACASRSRPRAWRWHGSCCCRRTGCCTSRSGGSRGCSERSAVSTLRVSGEVRATRRLARKAPENGRFEGSDFDAVMTLAARPYKERGSGRGSVLPPRFDATRPHLAAPRPGPARNTEMRHAGKLSKLLPGADEEAGPPAAARGYDLRHVPVAPMIVQVRALRRADIWPQICVGDSERSGPGGHAAGAGVVPAG